MPLEKFTRASLVSALTVLASLAATHAQVVLRPLPTNCVTLGDGLGRFHAGPAHWTIEGGTAHAFFGERLAASADFDHDGRMEWAVSAPRFQLDRRELSRIWVLGFPTGATPQVRWTWTGRQLALRQASALVTGDFNGDGFADLAWGSPRGNSGRAAMFAGSATGLVSQFSNVTYGGPAGSMFAFSLAAADLDGDGFTDLIAGEPGRNERQGRVRVHRGGAGGWASNSVWSVAGASAGEFFGERVVVLDANGDGQPDLAVSAPHYNNGTKTNAGQVRLFLGTNGAFASAPAWTFTGPAADAGFGYGLADLGDLDKDGREELGVGAPGLHEGGSWRGRAYIFHGTTNGLSRKPHWTVDGDVPDCGFGHALANVGDLNGDGWPDVAVGSPGVAPSYSAPSVLGDVRVWLGGPRGLAGGRPWRAFCAFPQTQTGWSVMALGDVNHDGLADFAVSSPQYSLMEEVVPRVGRVDIFMGHREGYAEAGKFPMDGVNSSTHEQAVAELTQRAGKVGAEKAARIRAELAALSSFAQETRNQQVTNARATGWLRWIGWSTPVVALGLLALWRWRRLSLARVAVHRERERLARDLHDGLGSGVHRLQRLTELLNQAKPDSPEAQRHREELLKTAQELGGSMDRAIWAVKPENDTLENFVSYLSGYAPSLLEPHGIACELDLPPAMPEMRFQGETRQHLFLAVNEALNNVARHSQARRAWLRVTQRDGWTEFVIEDDGRGLPVNGAARAGGGNGLRNQRARMAGIGGGCEVQARPGGGVRVVLRFRSPAAG